MIHVASQQKLSVEDEDELTKGLCEGCDMRGRVVLRHLALLPIAHPKAVTPAEKLTPLTFRSEYLVERQLDSGCE